MKKTALLLSLIASFLLFNSCSKDFLSLSNKNFNTEVTPTSNLEFTFSEDVVSDSLLGTWQDAEYVKISPKVEGKFRWIDSRTLSFSPTLGFAPSTEYTAELTSLIVERSKLKKKIKDEDIKHSFHTAYLTLLSTDFFWAKTDDVIEVKTLLNFNYIVNPAEIAKNLEIYIDGKKTNFLLKSSINAEVVEVSIPEAQNKYEQKPVKVLVKSGIGCLNSSFKTKEDLIFESHITAKGAFSITEITGDVVNDNHIFNIHTNQTIDKGQDFKSLIKVVDQNNDEVQGIDFELYDFGLYLKSDFKESENYEIQISGKLKGIFGGALGKDQSMYISFEKQAPKLNFSAKSATYLTSKGERNLGIKAVNVKEFEVRIYKIYENNIIHFLNNSNAIENYNYYEYSDYEGGYYDYYDGNSVFNGDYDNYGKLISSTVVQTASLARNGKQYLLNLNLSDVEAQKGIYAVKIVSNESYYLNDTKILAFSDLGMIVKEDKEDVYVFVNGIQSAQSESGVTLELISRNNQTIAKVESDGDGVAHFKGVKNKLDSELKMVFARKGNDFTYLHLNQTRVDVSKYDLGGETSTLSGYQLFLYGERDLYRPGEKINVNTVLRDDSYNTIESFPLEVVLRTPNGNEMSRVKGSVNAEGAFATSFTVPNAGLTGTYFVEVYSANKVLLNSRAISVEEFMPDRISVTTRLDKEEVLPSQAVTLSGVASNLFGTPAASRNYEVRYTVAKKYLSFDAYPEYNFSINADLSKDMKIDTREGKTSATGTFEESFEIPAELRNSGVYSAKTFSTVFDENGRPVSRTNAFEIHTQKEFLGIGSFSNYADIREPLTVPLVAVDKKGAPRTASAKVQVVKYNWRTVLQKTEYGEYRYQSQRQEQIVDEKSIVVGANSSYKFTVGQSGEYAVRLKRADSQNYVESYFYAYGYGYTSGSDFEVNTDGEVSIVADKKAYDLGDEANILFKTPFAGKLLVTIERNKVFEHRVIETDAKSASLKISMKEEYLPNVYISATLLRPISSNTNLPLTVAHGYLPIKVNKSAAKIPLVIEAVESSRSKTKQTIKVKADGRKNVQLTVAVVDEGILQIKNYKSPEPYEFFFRSRKLEVNSYDIYPRLFPELKIQKASFGADGYNMGKRLNPMSNKRVNLVSFWSGHLTTNGSGEATYTIDIPQFSGDLRIMAVAYQDKSFGSAEKHMKVADPIVVSAGLPRFLAPNDKVLVPVTLSNTTNKATDATIEVATGNILSVEGSRSQQITIGPKEEKRVYFSVLAKPNIGTEDVVITVKALGESFVEKTNLSIRPATPLEKKSDFGNLAVGKSSESIGDMAQMIPSTVSGKVIVGKSPLIQFSKNLNDLLQYPYGCVEQTVSTAFPQIYFNDLCKAISYKKGSAVNPNFNVQQAIEKLNTMMQSSGGLSYWPGGSYVSWYGSVYAAHFMIEAQKAGFKVDQNVLEKLMIYVGEEAKNKATETYYYYPDETYRTLQSKTIASKEGIYALYVLALKNRQDLPTMNYFKANQQLLSLDCKYLLAAGYKLVGDQASYTALLPASFSSEVSKRANQGSFYSYIRDESMVLNALLEVDKNNRQIPILANHISLQLRNAYWLSTQENAFAILALGKLSKLNNEKPSSGKVAVNGKTVLNYNGNNANEIYEFKGQGKVTVSNTGQGQLYYYVEYEGINPDSKIQERDNFLRVRRSYFDRNGKQLDGKSFKQNDLIVIKLSLENIEGTHIENVVVTDLLPAGFEIENSRLTESEEMNWINDKSGYDYMDVRDDRINFFTTASGTRNFYYLVRAVSPGSFVQGPCSADAMYNGEYQSYYGAGIVNISEK